MILSEKSKGIETQYWTAPKSINDASQARPIKEIVAGNLVAFMQEDLDFLGMKVLCQDSKDHTKKFWYDSLPPTRKLIVANVVWMQGDKGANRFRLKVSRQHMNSGAFQYFHFLFPEYIKTEEDKLLCRISTTAEKFRNWVKSTSTDGGTVYTKH